VISTAFANNLYPDVEEFVRRVEDAQNPATRAATDLGNMLGPVAGKFLVARTVELFKKRRLRWPDFPKAKE
jgi:hypothetical protein